MDETIELYIKLAGLPLKDWNGLAIRNSSPNVDRIWTKHENKKICFHKIYPIKNRKPFYHPHPWDFKSKIIFGSYWSDIGYSDDLTTEPPPVSTRIFLNTGSEYSMKSNVWHTVEPFNCNFVFSVVEISSKTQREAPQTCQNNKIMSKEQINKMLFEFTFKLDKL